MGVEFATNFYYLVFEFLKLLFLMSLMIIDIVLLAFLKIYCVKILKTNCYKRKRLVQVGNLFLEFEVPLIFHVMYIYIYIYFIAYRKRLGHIRFGGKSLNNLHIGT